MLDELETRLSQRVNGKPSLEAIGREMGLSKGSVIGQAGRMRKRKEVQGFTLAPANRDKPDKKRPPMSFAAKEGGPDPLKPMQMPIDRGECAYVMGDLDSGDWRYCGHKTVEQSSYCEFHRSACENPQASKKKK